MKDVISLTATLFVTLHEQYVTPYLKVEITHYYPTHVKTRMQEKREITTSNYFFISFQNKTLICITKDPPIYLFPPQKNGYTIFLYHSSMFFFYIAHFLLFPPQILLDHVIG